MFNKKMMLIAAALLLWCSFSGATSQASPPAKVATPPAKVTTPAVTDNGCSQTLDEAQKRTFNTQKIAALQALRQTHPCPVKVSMDTTVAFVNNLLSKAFDDPYTYMISPADAKDLDDQTNGKSADFDGGGIGVVLQWNHANKSANKRLFNGGIFRIIDGSPASQSKLKVSDRILAVNGKPVIGGDFQRVLEMIRGPVGVAVTLTVLDGRQIKHLRFNRKVITSTPVFTRDLGDGITAIVISTYDIAGVPELVQKAITATLPKTRAYEVDERGNPGGWVNECVATTQLFIRAGVILTENERIVGGAEQSSFDKLEYSVSTSAYNERHLSEDGHELSPSKPGARLPYLLNGRPVVLLTDGASASCSEIVAGALKDDYKPGPDWQGAVLIGTRTYGKGIGQTYVNGAMGSRLRVTSFQNLTPLNHWLGDAHNNRIGLNPDFLVENPRDAFPYSRDDRQAAFAKTFLLEQLQNTPSQAQNSPQLTKRTQPATPGFSATTQMSPPSS